MYCPLRWWRPHVVAIQCKNEQKRKSPQITQQIKYRINSEKRKKNFNEYSRKEAKRAKTTKTKATKATKLQLRNMQQIVCNLSSGPLKCNSCKCCLWGSLLQRCSRSCDTSARIQFVLRLPYKNLIICSK